MFIISCVWYFVSCFYGELVDDDVMFVSFELFDLGLGEVFVCNMWLSVDLYMCGWMNDVKFYVVLFVFDVLMDGGVVGVVE